MAKVYETISAEHQAFIEAQHLFFVATAPLAADGHVNLSPKGLDALRVLSPNRVAYLDLTGSGNETSAHLRENGRITLMFCAFAGSPKILRLYGTGSVVLPDEPAWVELRARFDDYLGIRQIVIAEITRVQTSCGFAVPLMDYVKERDTLLHWAESKGEERLAEYRQEHNVRSIDGLIPHLAAPGRR